MTEETKSSSPRNSGIYADKPWSEGWKRNGFNGCITTAIEALRFLTHYQVPSGGEQSYNWEHLYSIARELNDVRDDLRVFYLAGHTYPDGAQEWPEEWKQDGYCQCLPLAAEALRYLAERPAEKTGPRYMKHDLLELADHLTSTRDTLFNVPHLMVGEKLDVPRERISAANLPEGMVIRDPEQYRRDFEARHADALTNRGPSFGAGGGHGGVTVASGHGGIQGGPGGAGGGTLGGSSGPLGAAVGSTWGGSSSPGGNGGASDSNGRTFVATGVGGAGYPTAPEQTERIQRALKLGPDGVATYNAQVRAAVEHLKTHEVVSTEVINDILALQLPNYR